jgi:O-antigen/teichoic acid export membrane protein
MRRSRPSHVTDAYRREDHQAAVTPTAGLVAITARTAIYKGVSGAAAAGITITTARSLGPQGRGAFVLLFTLATITYLACTLGVNTGARVHLVARPRIVALGDYLGLTLAQVTLQTAICALLGALLLPLVDVDLSLPGIALLGMLGGSLLGQYMVFDAINAYGRTALAAALDAAGSVSQLLLVFGLSLLQVHRVAPYIGALAVANGLQILLEVRALQQMELSLRPRFRRREWGILLRSGAPGTALSLAQMLTYRLDRYLVGIFLTPSAVGVYSVAAAVPELLRIPSFALSYAIFYRIASGIAEPADFQALRRWFIGGTVVLSTGTFLVAPLLIRVAFGPTYNDSVGPLRILLLAEVGVTVFHLDSASLAALDRIRQAAGAAVAGLAVVVLADLWLIPSFGIRGAAWASVAGYSVMGVAAALWRGRQSGPRNRVTGHDQEAR